MFNHFLRLGLPMYEINLYGSELCSERERNYKTHTDIEEQKWIKEPKTAFEQLLQNKISIDYHVETPSNEEA